MTTRDKLAALRALMKRKRIDATFVPSADPHQSEYLPDCWKRRAWLSGFTGSAGDLMVTSRRAALWTDSRYFLQAELELKGSGIQLMRLGLSGTPSLTAWAAGQLRRGQVLAVDPRVMSVAAAGEFAREFGAEGIKVRYLARNLVDEIWRDRPEASLAPLRTHSLRYAGESTASKLRRLRAAMQECGAKVHVLAALDAIAWLFNIRSEDIAYTPVAISYAVVTERTATLFVDPGKVTPQVRRHLAKHVGFRPYGELPQALTDLRRRRPVVWIDPQKTNRWILDLLKGCEFVFADSPLFAMKAVKNPVQIAGIRAAHVRDGVAMVKFLRWLQKEVRRGKVTELLAACKVDEFRLQDPMCRDCSFETISAYAGHAAIIHYAVDESSDVPLRPRGLYLIDSGGQYLDGTTDITRTVALGRPTPREKEAFTRVLKANITCTRTPFPAGTTGQRHELHARQPLWEVGRNYGHGTGHGVGQYLGVHEGPCSLKNVPTVPLEPGHLLSIEPGMYETNKFGIRIENMAFVSEDKSLSSPTEKWYRFDPVTLCPLDLRLVDRTLLTPPEKDWLNSYHKKVYKWLSRHLDSEHKAWLKKATRSV